MQEDNKLKELIGIAIGKASMCWSETPKGIFDSSKAIDISEKLFKDILILVKPFLR